MSTKRKFDRLSRGRSDADCQPVTQRPPLDKVTVIPRRHAVGATEQIPKEGRYKLRLSYLRGRIGVMLGVRASERQVFDEVSSGAEYDLKQDTRLARYMVTHWGMSEKLGPVAFRWGEEHIFLGQEEAQQQDFSECTAKNIDDEIGSLIRSIEEEVTELLEEHRNELDTLAHAMLEKEILKTDDIQMIIRQDTT